jgi:hypothetical protein
MGNLVRTFQEPDRSGTKPVTVMVKADSADLPDKSSGSSSAQSSSKSAEAKPKSSNKSGWGWGIALLLTGFAVTATAIGHAEDNKKAKKTKKSPLLDGVKKKESGSVSTIQL